MTIRRASPLMVVFLLLALACGGNGPVGVDAARACSSEAVPAPIALDVGQYVEIDPSLASGCAILAANTSFDAAEYLAVVVSTGHIPGGAAPYRLSAAPAGTAMDSGPAPLAAVTDVRSAQRSIPARFDATLRALGSRHAGQPRQRPATAPVASNLAATPPALGSARTFRVCANLDCGASRMVGARARAVGAHVAIYIDTLAPSPGFSAAQIDSLIAALDGRLFTTDAAMFGTPTDLDGNGVVIALLTGAVNALTPRAACGTASYVAGFFLPNDLNPATDGNDGEIVYLMVPDPAGTLSCAHASTEVMGQIGPTFVHELQHLINFGQHVVMRGGAAEEGWLDEALSRIAEGLGGRSYLPADSGAFTHYVLDDLTNTAQYLADPSGHFLLTTTDHDLADVGAGWMYLRFLVDQFGPEILARMEQTSLTGTANVAAATGAPFDQTVIDWALTNWVSDLPGFTAPRYLRYTSWSFRRAMRTLHALDPVDYPDLFPLNPMRVAGDTLDVTGELHAGSGSYFLIERRGDAGPINVRIDAAVSPTALAPRLVVMRLR